MDLSSENLSMERIMQKTLNQPPQRLNSDNYLLSFKNEKLNLTIPSKQIESLLNKIAPNNKDNILNLSISEGKRKSFRLNIKDRVCQILNEFFLAFTIGFRQNVIKKSLEVFNSIMNKKFEEKVKLLNNIHEQIASIKMMIYDEKSNFYFFYFRFFLF